MLLPIRFWSQERTVHRGMVGTSVGKAIFTDLDFADGVALLAKMLSVLVLALEVMNEEAQPLGLTINWAKTKIQTTDVTTTWLYSPSWWKQCGGSRYLYISWLSTSQLRWKRA